jgi:DNA mismatch endonuclease, patch repair protein
MDTVSKEKRSRVMRLVKSQETSLEKKIRSRLWKRGIRYRENKSTLFGKPDLLVASKKVVVFIDSCFWHGCDMHLRMPRSNIDYWVNKINRNKKRDRFVNSHYKKRGWNILRFWEHQIKDNIELSVQRIAEALDRK